jgi:hypothetical protein
VLGRRRRALGGPRSLRARAAYLGRRGGLRNGIGGVGGGALGGAHRGLRLVLAGRTRCGVARGKTLFDRGDPSGRGQLPRTPVPAGRRARCRAVWVATPAPQLSRRTGRPSPQGRDCAPWRPRRRPRSCRRPSSSRRPPCRPPCPAPRPWPRRRPRSCPAGNKRGIRGCGDEGSGRKPGVAAARARPARAGLVHPESPTVPRAPPGALNPGSHLGGDGGLLRALCRGRGLVLRWKVGGAGEDERRRGGASTLRRGSAPGRGQRLRGSGRA